MTETGSLSDEPGTCSPSSSGGSSQSSGNGSYFKKKGKVKWFNISKGWGFITPTDGSQEVFVHQSVIQMSGFRSLGEEEEVEFECKESGKGLEATLVTGPDGGDCHGSNRRPISKRKLRKIRCYNCGDLAHHVAAKCSLGPQPKRCHNCKGEDHLIADCPIRIEKRKNKKNGSLCENGTSSTVSDSGTHITAEEFNTDEEVGDEEEEEEDDEEENCIPCN